jgi:lipooligosaccharide transport system ATP-binding protein
MSEPDYAVFAENLRKSYGDFEAVRGINFGIRRGECYGFLGPNGAGKSTTMRMIYRASAVGSGTLRVLGHDASNSANDRAIKARIGVVHQEDNLDQELTVEQTLQVFCRFHRLHGAAAEARVEELLVFADLAERRHSLVITLSGGMKRRLMVARGLIGNPDLVVLDEPTTGLDPRARAALWDRLAALRRRGATLVLTTHYMDEAERLCDRLAMVDDGRIVAEGTPAALIAAHVGRAVLDIEVADVGDAPDARVVGDSARWVDRIGDRILVATDDGDSLMSTIAPWLAGRPHHLRRASLEDVFLRLTGRALDGTSKS